MAFLKLINNTITYPYNTYSDYPNTSFPTGYDYPDLDIYWVHPSPQRNPDPNEYNAVEVEPVFNILDKQWEQAWDYVPKTEEEKRQAKYNPAAFLLAMFASATFNQWIAQFTPFQQTGFSVSGGDAKNSGDWSAVQSIYDGLKASVAPPESSVDEWQALAETHGIPLLF